MAHPDLVPNQHLAVMHVAAFNALAAGLRPLPAIETLLDRILASPNCPQDPTYLAVIHSAAISARIKLKDINGAFTSYTQLVDAKGLVPRRSAVSALVQAVVQRHQPVRFRRILADIHAHHQAMQPDVQLANHIVRGLCAFESIDAATQFVATTYPAWSLLPDPITFAFLVQAAIEQGDTDRAKAILAGMKAQGLGIGWQAYRPLLVAAAKAGDLVALDRVLTQIRTDAQDVDRELPRIADVIVGELMHAKHTELAETFLANLSPNMRTVGVYNAYISGLVSATAADKDGERMRKALDMYQVQMPKAGIAPDVVTLNTLVAGLAHRREYTRAMRLLDEASVPVTSLSYNPLLLAAARDKDAKVFSVIESTMRAHGISELDAVGMDAKVECFARAGDMETALQVVARMDKPTVKTHLVLLEALVVAIKVGSALPHQKRMCRRAIDQILARVEAAHNELGKSTFAILLHLLASRRQLDRPHDAIRIYLKHADQFAITKSIASAVLRAAQRTSAPATAKTVVQRWTQQEHFVMHATLHEMYLDILAGAGWLDDSLAHLQWMKEHKADMDETHLRAITGQLMRAGQPDAARKLAAHLVQVYPELKRRPVGERIDVRVNGWRK
ncbi:hypothetical protein BCR44DRAFT_61251 [Catenaria anguillulae PL171]|uniref:Pentacotripeptide-repeat region of PRORP domain-containing protein n=1 Tax=Catenaria anguillulae PL171 TaxID=765915 RepID=A0A1Y2I3S7_9FUNG|nr:hypothetical protein BCR44DRAFT_61251 [Catenaria anguillulae PL171]